jgi:hypothetical protein
MASWGSGQFLSTIILLAVLFGDCSGKQDIPEGLLNKQEMTHVMIQIHLLEAKIGRLGLRTDSAKVVYKHFESELFRELKMDTSYFNKSFSYYSKKPEIFTKIYNAVVDSLIEMESREQLIEDEEKKAMESDTLQNNVLIDSLTTEKNEPEVKELDNGRKLQKFRRVDSTQMNKQRQQ